MFNPVVCIGASVVDELFHIRGEFIPATTNKAVVMRSPGGVARNIAQQLALLNVPVQLISVFGNDADGDRLKAGCLQSGIQLDACITTEAETGKYTGVLKPDGSLLIAFISSPAVDLITPEHLTRNSNLLSAAAWLLADTNLTNESLGWLMRFAKEKRIPLVLEPVSVPPAKKLRQSRMDGVYLITPNEDELPALVSEDIINEPAQALDLLQRGVRYVWVHKGRAGSVLYSEYGTIALPAPAVDVTDSTGAGDAAVAAFIFGKLIDKSSEECLKLAHTMAAEILQVHGSVANGLDQSQLLRLVSKYYPT